MEFDGFLDLILYGCLSICLCFGFLVTLSFDLISSSQTLTLIWVIDFLDYSFHEAKFFPFGVSVYWFVGI